MRKRPSLIQEYPFTSALILGLTVYLGLFLLFDGFYYQTESDSVFPTYIFGFYSAGENVIPNSFGCYSVLSDGFNFLYRNGVSTKVYDWFHICCTFFCCCYWIHFFLKGKREHWLALPFLVNLFDVAMPFEFSKTAIVLAVTGLHITSVYRTIFTQLIGAIVLSVGALIRPETAAIASVLLTSHLAIQAKWSTVFLSFRKLIVPFTVLAGLGFTVFNSESTYKDVEYKRIRQYEYALVDFQRGLADADSLTIVDSIKISAAEQFFFADQQEINHAFFEQVGIKPIDKTPASLISNFFEFDWVSRGLEQFISSIHGLGFHFLLLIVLLLVYALKRETNAVLIAASMIIIVLMSVFLKTEPHFITGTMMCAVLLSIRQNRQAIESDTGSNCPIRKDILLTALVGLSAILALVEKIEFIGDSKCKSDYYTQVSEELSRFNHSDLVLNISFWDRLHYKLFTPIQPAGSNEITVIDGGILYLSNGYQNMLSERTGKTTFLDQYFWMVYAQKTFVSSEERMRLLTDYVNVVYNQELKYIHLNGVEIDSCKVNSPKIGFYRCLIENEISDDGDLPNDRD